MNIIDLLFNPGPATEGPYEVSSQEAVNPTPVGEMFIGVANPNTGRCIARISAKSRLDAEDMGNAYLLAASWDMREALEIALVEMGHCRHLFTDSPEIEPSECEGLEMHDEMCAFCTAKEALLKAQGKA